MNEKIFIAIPAANDPQLIETISRAIDNSQNPERLTIAFSTQYSDGLFEKYFGIKVKDVKKIINSKGAKIIHLNMKNGFNSGVCVTRNKLANLLTDEQYFFSIDSHTSFAKNWDKSLVDEYKILKKYFKKPIITGYIGNSLKIRSSDPNRNDYKTLNDRNICSLFDSEYIEDRYFVFYTDLRLTKNHCEFKVSYIKKESNREIIKISDNRFFTVIQHLTAHNIFVMSDWVKEVNWPMYIKFYGEEQDMSLRSFLSGYDMVTSNRRYISDFGQTSNKKQKDFLNYSLNYGTQELAKLLLTGKNNYYDFSKSKRSPIEWMKANFIIDNDFIPEIITDEFDWVEEF